MGEEFKVGRTFSSFSEFEEEFKNYMDATCQLFVRKNSRTVKQANAGLMTKSCLYSEDLKFVNAVYTCKRGGQKRIKSGDGTREIQGTWKIDCPAQLRIKAQSRTLLEVSELRTSHNHSTSRDDYLLFPEVRTRIPDPDVERDVVTLLKAKVKPSAIRILLKGFNSGQLNPRDLANRRAKMKREIANGRSEDQMLLDLLAELQEEDPGTYINVVKDNEDALINLFVQTSKMRENFQRHNFIILSDHTYKNNKNRMPVALIMAMNGNGEGIVVGVAFLANEEKENVGHTLQAFINSSGEVAIKGLKTCIIDKDMSEMAALHAKMPHVNIQLCDFHVANVFSTKSASENDEVKRLLKHLRYAETEDDFLTTSSKLKKEAILAFWHYFEKNWLKFPAAWSYQDKKNQQIWEIPQPIG